MGRGKNNAGVFRRDRGAERGCGNQWGRTGPPKKNLPGVVWPGKKRKKGWKCSFDRSVFVASFRASVFLP